MKKNIINRIFVIVVSLGIIGALIIALLYNGYLRFNYPSKKEYPIQGIDISHHQKEIDWNEIDSSEVQFVYIKATEGGDFKDSKFLFNWKEAKERNFAVGAYHFFTFCKSGKEQAQNFIETVPMVKGSLPPVIDLEFGGNCKLKKSKEEVLAEIDTMQNELFLHYKKKPIFYVTQYFYDNFLLNKFPLNPIWYRDIYKKPTLKDGRNWNFWQYGNRGHLKGINTYVDLNVYNGDKISFQKLMR